MFLEEEGLVAMSEGTLEGSPVTMSSLGKRDIS